MKLESMVKTSLDELRMQMLGAQALFGFEFQGLFQDNFDVLPSSARIADAAGLGLMVAVLGLIVAVPCQHRIVEQGNVTPRLLHISLRYAKYTLAPLAAAVSCNVFVAARHPFGSLAATALSITTFVLGIAAWYALGLAMRKPHGQGGLPMQQSSTPLRVKIEQLLTEARVILPGAQALLGFQFVVMMMSAFDQLPAAAKLMHLIALMSLVLAVTLLIAPAAIHRLAFEGRDDPRLHAVGSVIITSALLPLALAICCDLWVALFKLSGTSAFATSGALLAAGFLLGLWFLLPYIIRAVSRRSR